jgi:hypothetical protein
VIGTVLLYVDYSVPVESLRAKLKAIVKTCRAWDGSIAELQVTASKETSMELRITASAATAAAAWELRAELREKLIAWLLATYPSAFPRRPSAAASAKDDGEHHTPERIPPFA